MALQLGLLSHRSIFMVGDAAYGYTTAMCRTRNDPGFTRLYRSVLPVPKIGVLPKAISGTLQCRVLQQ